MQPEHTRALRLAAHASDRGEMSLLAHLASQHVALTVNPSRPADLAAAELLAANLARLPIHLSIETNGLRAAVRERLKRAANTTVAAAAEPASTPLQRPSLRVHVGPGGDADLFAAASHHGAVLGADPVDGARPASGLGAVICAALATGEVFKRITLIRPDRMLLHDQLVWCPVTLGGHPESVPVAEGLPALDVALIGLGAVGTAVARILGLLGATGRASLVDPERFAVENVGTYSLGDGNDAQQHFWKTELVRRALPGMTVESQEMPVGEFIERVDEGRARWPALAITGLDSVDARRNAQMLWPDRLLDAATGDTMCGLHDVGLADRACLRCLFAVPTAGPDAAQRLADHTGLDPSVLRHGDQPLREDHVAHLDDARRSRLLSQVGKPICGLAQATGLTDLPSDDYRPSVPFVSQQAACLAIGRVIADRLGLDGATFVQYDALIGPHAGTFDRHEPVPSCYCQRRSDLVDRLRTLRAANLHQQPES